jgi:hypothetical protein
MNPDSGRAMAIPEDPEMITAAEQAAREVDNERREVSEFVEQLRRRQTYFFEKAQMHREAADHYTRMSEDLAQLLDNSYVHGESKTAMKERR